MSKIVLFFNTKNTFTKIFLHPEAKYLIITIQAVIIL
jgi:hypothetical protein